MKYCLLAAALILATPQLHAADDDARAEFQRAYTAYQHAVENKDRSEARTQAEIAYRTGREVFGDAHANTAALASNYGRLLNSDEAEEIFREALQIYIKVYGENAPELIDPLMDMAKVEVEYGRLSPAVKYYSRALELAEEEDGKDSKLVALLKLEVGQIALQEAQSRKAIRYLKEAREIFSKFDDQEAEIGMARANFWIGKYRIATNSYKNATEELLASLATFEKYAPNASMTMTNHAFLIHAYEKRGLRDEATKHCRAIGAAKPHDPTQDYMPVFRTFPTYPRGAQEAGQEGSVVIALTVDEDGFVREPHVVERSGASSFERAALEAVEQFRYVPRFEGGKAVATADVKYRFTFELAD